MSEENKRRLKANKPMWLTPEMHNFLPDGVEVIIVGGETQEEILLGSSPPSSFRQRGLQLRMSPGRNIAPLGEQLLFRLKTSALPLLTRSC
ncbi:MAG: hypothetical protein HY646_12475 [Acidobacteria bacterium]|nr:hypothetical protein [Acidobacteriota bacterium]